MDLSVSLAGHRLGGLMETEKIEVNPQRESFRHCLRAHTHILYILLVVSSRAAMIPSSLSLFPGTVNGSETYTSAQQEALPAIPPQQELNQPCPVG